MLIQMFYIVVVVVVILGLSSGILYITRLLLYSRMLEMEHVESSFSLFYDLNPLSVSPVKYMRRSMVCTQCLYVCISFQDLEHGINEVKRVSMIE